jgi:hypothetical protein
MLNTGEEFELKSARYEDRMGTVFVRFTDRKVARFSRSAQAQAIGFIQEYEDGLAVTTSSGIWPILPCQA